MATPPTAWKSNAAFNKFNPSYFNGDVDASQNIIIRNGNVYVASNSSIYSTTNQMFFDDVYSYINFYQNIHIFGSLVLDHYGISHDVANDLYDSVIPTLTNIFYDGATTITSLGGLFTFTGTLNGISPTTFGYLDATSSIQTQLNSLSTTTAANTNNLTNISYNSGTSTTTFSGNLSFPATSINSAAILNNNFLALSGVQSCSGNKTFAGNIILSSTGNLNANGLLQSLGAYLRVDGELHLNANALIISQATLQKLQYLSTLASDVQVQINNCAKTNSTNTFTLGTTFSVAPTMSGANITAGTIPATALASSSFLDLTTNQTITSGIKTFSVAPVLSGGSITNGTIPNSALATQYLDLTSNQSLASTKTLTVLGNIIANSQTLAPEKLGYLNRIIYNSTNGFYQIFPSGATFPSFGSASQNLSIGVSTVDQVVLLASTGSTAATNTQTGFEFCAITGNTPYFTMLKLQQDGANFNVGVNITGGLNFSGSINAIPNTTLGYINGLTSSAQSQINTTNTNVSNLTTQVNKIGTLITVAITSTAITYVSTVFKNIGSISLTAGTWLVNTQVHMLGGGTFSITVPSVFGFSTSATTLPNAADDPQMTGTTNASIGITYFYQFYLKPTATTTYYLNTQPNFAGGGLNNGARTVIRAVQIA